MLDHQDVIGNKDLFFQHVILSVRAMSDVCPAKGTNKLLGHILLVCFGQRFLRPDALKVGQSDVRYFLTNILSWTLGLTVRRFQSSLCF